PGNLPLIKIPFLFQRSALDVIIILCSEIVAVEEEHPYREDDPGNHVFVSNNGDDALHMPKLRNKFSAGKYYLATFFRALLSFACSVSNLFSILLCFKRSLLSDTWIRDSWISVVRELFEAR